MDGYEKAIDEFDRLERRHRGDAPDDWPIVYEYKDEILALVRRFFDSGQSGGSAPYTASIISQVVKKLCMYEPIGGIDDLDEDWGKLNCGKEITYQNKRLSSVFKDEGVGAYFLYAIVWQGEDKWDSFTGHVEGIGSAHYIKAWPFEPKTFRIDVVRELNATHPDRVTCSDGDYLYRIKDRKQLEAVWEYYDQKK